MKKLFMGLALMAAGSLSAVAQGVEGFIVEKFYVTNAADNAGNGNTATPLPTGSVVWRFYVDMAAGWELQSVYGDPNHELRIETSTSFFNNTDRGEAFGHAIANNQLVNNTVYIDSYLSMGGVSTARAGVLKTEDDGLGNLAFVGGYLQNNDASAGIPLTTQDGALSPFTPVGITPVGINTGVFAQSPDPGNVFSTSSGAWATTASCVGPTASNRVLIAQITSDGVLTYAFNVQVRNITTLAVENWVPSNPQGAELVLPALAGVVNQANALPVVNITAPTNGASYLVGQTVTIDATATDPDGSISNVEFLVNGVVVGSDNTSPYSFDYLATPAGNKAITVRATDNLGGQTTSSAVNITVGNVVPPTVSITAPAANATFFLGSNVTIDATAADADGVVTQVEFFANGVSVGVDNSSPYSVVWTPAATGNYSLTAIATDDDAATTTSTAVPVQIFDGSTSYIIVSDNQACSSTNFCLPIQALSAVNDVIGYDIVMNFDNTKVIPTGVVIVDTALINPAFTSTANSIDLANGIMYISVFFNASAPIEAEFEGTGRLLCVEFAKTAGFLATDTAEFSVSSLQESYINGVQPKVVGDGEYSSFQETEFFSSLKFWANNAPIAYNSANPSQFLITNIYGDNGTCTGLSATAVQPDVNGEFVYDIANGSSVNIQKDILNTTSVQPVVNGFDAFLTRRVLINDASFIPSVYQIIAMDVNTDGVVSAGDLSQINQRAVLVIGEFRQDWNYNQQGVSNGQASKDWLFIDGSTLNSDPAYVISANYPFPDGSGYSKSNVPDVSFCSAVPVQSTGACQTFAVETYTGILVGDVNGNYATVSPNSLFRSTDKLVFDLSKAVVENGVAEIPVYAVVSENINSVDFAMNFNMSNVAFDGVKTAENVESLSNISAVDSKLRFTSFSLDGISTEGAVAYVRFSVGANGVESADLASVEAYINGEAVNAEVIGSRVSEVAVDVFPNPANDVINVIVSENASLELMDLSGKMISAQSVANAYQKYEVSTSNLANGIYVLKVNTASGVTMKKVVVQK